MSEQLPWSFDPRAASRQFFGERWDRELDRSPRDPAAVEKIRQRTIEVFKQKRMQEIPDWSGNADVTRYEGAIKQSFDKLKAAAYSGDNAAFAAIVRIAGEMCFEVRQLSCCHQDAADDIARHRTDWPLLMDGKPEFRDLALRWLEILPIAASLPWKAPVSNKAWSSSTPAVRAILAGLRMIEFERSQNGPAIALPQFDAHVPAAVEAWFEAICARVLHPDAPGASELVRKLGASRAKHKANSGTASFEAHARAEAKGRLRKTFNSMYDV